MRTPDPEQELLAACVRLRPPEAERIAALVERVRDWERVRRLEHIHRLLPQLHDLFAACDWSGVPPDVRRWLSERRVAIAEQSLLLCTELLRTVEALRLGGIEALAFKGAVLAERYYHDPGLREFRDIDLLVHPADLARALERLKALGYAMTPDELSTSERAAYHRYHFAYTGSHRDHAGKVDLHWRMLPSTWHVPVDHEGLWSRAVEVRIAGRSVRTFGREDTLFLQALHGAKMRWPRLRLVLDFARIAAASPEPDWATALERAERQRARRIFLLAVHLARELSGASIPEELLRAAAADPTVAELGRRVVGHLRLEHYLRSDIFRLSGFRYRVFDSLIDKLCYIVRTLATPRLHHLRAFRLPLGLRFLAWPLKLGHDYLLLPLWLAWKRLARRA